MAQDTDLRDINILMIIKTGNHGYPVGSGRNSVSMCNRTLPDVTWTSGNF